MQVNHGQSEIQVFTNHYSAHNVISSDEAKSELRIFNSVVATNRQLQQVAPVELMTNSLSTVKIKSMFPNLSKLTVTGLLQAMSTVDSECGFSALSHVKSNLHTTVFHV